MSPQGLKYIDMYKNISPPLSLFCFLLSFILYFPPFFTIFFLILISPLSYSTRYFPTIQFPQIFCLLYFPFLHAVHFSPPFSSPFFTLHSMFCGYSCIHTANTYSLALQILCPLFPFPTFSNSPILCLPSHQFTSLFCSQYPFPSI